MSAVDLVAREWLPLVAGILLLTAGRLLLVLDYGVYCRVGVVEWVVV